MAHVMIGHSHPASDRPRGTGFLLWGWALLLVVLLSAAPSGAQPATRLVGSAFDPSTVSVTVRPNTREDGTAIRRLRADGPADDVRDPLPRLYAVANAGAFLHATLPAQQVALVTTQPAALPRQALHRAHPARAPPLS